MNPAFSPSASRELVPIFLAAARSLTQTWKDLLSARKDNTEVFNIPKWSSRATLDAIGNAGFNHDFGAMKVADNRLSAAYSNLFADMFRAPSDGMLLTNSLTSFIPPEPMAWILKRLPNRSVARAQKARHTSTEVAQRLVSVKSSELMNSVEGKKDVMSILVRANNSENEKTRMNREELLSTMRVVFIAGHETTANSLSWTLLELSRHPKIQSKLRKEIHLKEQEIAAEGRTDVTAEDLDSMPYLNAVLKESLRYNPVAPHIEKMAAVDDCVPLSESIQSTSGKDIDEIYVKKGQKVYVSITAYHRNTSIFGDDAHLFNPERWLEEKSGHKMGPSVGAYANLLTFSGGVRSCIGWRFAVIELQTFLAELVSNFEFSLTPESEKIRREACRIMVPMIEGEQSKGVQCPLRVRYVPRDY